MITFEQLVDYENKHLSQEGKVFKLDDDQKKAIQAQGNVVVSAGAGSGKTMVLAHRFLRLMLDGNRGKTKEGTVDCDRILALTFTKKAAREMKGRIGTLLQGLANGEGLDDESHRFFSNQFHDHFPLATICTLDSFCSTIVRSDSLHYGLTADFTIDEEKNKKQARTIARAMLWKVDDDLGAKTLASLYAGDTLQNLLVSLAVQAYHLPHAFSPEYGQAILGNVEERCDKTKETIRKILGDFSAFDLHGASKTVTQAKEYADCWLGSLSDDKAWLEFSATKCPWRKPGKVTGGDLVTLKENHDTLLDAKQMVKASLSLLGNTDQFLAAVAFLTRYEQEFQKRKRESGVLCFNDVSSLAVDILKRNVPLRRTYGDKFDYIMIDEFQDNNVLQKDLLYLLSAKREYGEEGVPSPSDLVSDKLFFVGDEKQSIYRFRGADVSVFKQLVGEFDAIHMETNYRTESFLIQTFSKMFSTIMQDASKPFQAEFKDLKPAAGKDKAPSTLTLLVKPREENQEKLTGDEEQAKQAGCEAYAVASLMEEMMHGDNYLIPDKEGGYRRPTANDMALLLRSGSHQIDFEKAMKRFSIPYTIVSTSRSLMMESPANDLYSLLQLLVHPDDRIAYATVLRSPFCNLPDALMEQVMASGKEIFDKDASQDMLYQNACESFSQLKAGSTQTLPALVQKLWDGCGYRFSLLSHPNFHAYLEHYDYLFHLAENDEEQGKSLVEFLDGIRPYLGKNDKMEDVDGTILTEKRDGVQVLTIHSSKGLEFPIVFVGNTSSSGGRGRGSGSVQACGETVPAKMYSAEDDLHDLFDEKDVEKEENDAELRRVLYVALTRAKYHLVISGGEVKKEDSVSNDTMLDMCVHSLGVDFDNLTSSVVPEVIVRKIPDIPLRKLWSDRAYSSVKEETIGDWYGKERKDEDLSSLRIAVTSFAPEGMHSGNGVPLPLLDIDSFLQEKDLTAAWGTFVHALVMREMGLYKVGVPDEKLFPDELKALSKAEQKRLVTQGKVLSDRFQDSSFYQKDVKPFLSAAKAETHFFSREEKDGEKVVVEGSIDLLIQRDGCYDVIDFKTDQIAEATVHKGQVDVYRRAVEKATGKKTRGCIVYLRDPSRSVWWN